MQNTQYFIEGNLVSCTVFNDAGLAFMQLLQQKMMT